MKKITAFLVILSLFLCLTSCRGADEAGAGETSSVASLEESLRERFGSMYDGLETGILMEGSSDAYWRLNGDTLTLFGSGAFVSMAAGFFPWKNLDENIAKVHITEGATALGAYGFYKYDGLVEVKIDSEAFVGMGMGCFGGNKSLRTVELGGRPSEIPTEAFAGCEALEYITIPVSVTHIGFDAFGDCSALKTVRYGGSAEAWSKVEISGGNDSLSRAQIIFEG